MALVYREDIHVPMGDHCMWYLAKQQQAQRYQASSLSPHLQYHIEAGLWASSGFACRATKSLYSM